MRLRAAAAAAFLALLAACAPRTDGIVSAAVAPPRPAADWAFEASDIPVDPAFRFGKLANGMRFVIRPNGTPAGTAIVRLEVAAGSLDEAEHERGLAHFVEHMAFNGSTNIPEGEMVRLLERKGLAFGADTNAATSFERTTYKLDLPRNDPDLLDTALMLMRETASELTISPEAVERERGVLLAELRDRNTYAFRNAVDEARFAYPAAHYTNRFPIGTTETLQAASADDLRGFYAREYVPQQTTIVVIGDFEPELVEAGIRRHFAGWEPRAAQKQPDAGPVDPRDAKRTAIHLDPALPERITAARHGPWLDEPDTIAQRQENLLRQIGYAIVNRRLSRLSRQASPPFRDAGFGTGPVFKAARTTRLIVDTADRKWQRGLSEAVREYRRAMAFGFTGSEVAEQVANIRREVANNAASASTRSHAALEDAVWALLREDTVPSDPESVAQRFEAFAPAITPDAVMAALRREAVPLDRPLLRFRGRYAPEGEEKALRRAWNAAMKEPLDRPEGGETGTFAYTDFGPAGTVVSDAREPALGIRTVRFANGVRLSVKRTAIEQGRVRVQLTVDGGQKLNTPENPLATQLVPFLPSGGLGQHSRDDLQTILAGRTVGSRLSAGPAAFISTAQTTPADLELQMQLMTALLTDPGYRAEGVTEYRHFINSYFKQMDATPASKLAARIGAILSDDDPRFSLQPVESYRDLTFDKLANDISDRLANGAIEIGIVGDIDEEQAIALVARTLGALPPREAEFRDYGDQPARRFTADRGQRVLRHTGPADQALIHLVWPTRDDSDPVEAIRLELLRRIVRIRITETLREALGQAYSPRAANDNSRHWPGYGTFSVTASVDVGQVKAARAALVETLADLRAAPPPADLIDRARQPMIEGFQNALKANSGWLTLVDRAQSEPDQIDRFIKAEERLVGTTAQDIAALLARYLDPSSAVEVLVLPEGVPPP